MKVPFPLIGALGAGLVAGVFAGRELFPPGSIEPRIVEGYVSSNNTATAIGFRENLDQTAEEGYTIGPRWRGGGGGINDNSPTCVEPLAQAAHVRIGLVEIEATDDSPGYTAVVWLECLD